MDKWTARELLEEMSVRLRLGLLGLPQKKGPVPTLGELFDDFLIHFRTRK